MYTFPYENKRIKEGVIPNPRISLKVHLQSGPVWIRFLVDSGADVTTLPFYPYAELVNFKKNPKEKITIGGIENKGVSGYPFSLNAELKGYKFSLRGYFINSLIEPLLGRLDIWKLFSLTFNNKKLRTEFTPIVG
ncbi:hypothetical protein A3D77_00355 [Candidatus Gottesmanbacteria bacterium RIFCSPHIGHO2_02_FULL_39_11]|uniref:Peptidase A2 domain-containing protein n=1 Tax=Candidatus Gottesmanbacteria bacterium RIFCSPHIGHO2_02_FULL_39_11 TaxID=1798382 RepID=A0A1F5ZLG2_9BACT|nr:MAG: hypothetical protein A3D77_00355 [Candidatus Gottesmanbacteria bacterium RIFCSPHIGHO2_02_FULL_39_11]